jgi:hypothetical protein
MPNQPCLSYTGDALGGLINASLGNATEFIIVRTGRDAVFWLI